MPHVRRFYAAWLALAAALALETVPGYAADLPCFHVEAVQRATAELAQQGAEATVLAGQDAQSYLEALNRYPPVTHLSADSLIVVSFPGHGVSIWLVEGPRACLGGKVAADVHARLMAAVGQHGA